MDSTSRIHHQITLGEERKGSQSTHAAAVARAGGKEGGGRVQRRRRWRGHRLSARLRLAPGTEGRGDARASGESGAMLTPGSREPTTPSTRWVERSVASSGSRSPGSTSTNCSALANHRTARKESPHAGRGAPRGDKTSD